MNSKHNAIAGPGPNTTARMSSSDYSSSSIVTPPESAEIPSFGLSYFEYRRRLFLAGLPIPETPYPPPATYTIDLPLPEPLPSKPRRKLPFTSAIARLETALEKRTSRDPEELAKAWEVVRGVHTKLMHGTRATTPIRLGLVIKTFWLSWIKDGTWPIDPETKRPLTPPESPVLAPIEDPVAAYIDPLGERTLIPPITLGLGKETLREGDTLFEGIVGNGTVAELDEAKEPEIV